MILYHGSFVAVGKPDILHSRRNVDFGVGFYTTPLRDQAVKWCQKFKIRGKDAIISVYEFDESAFERYKCLRFDSYSEQWLDFVAACRRGADVSDYDIVAGGVADDRVFNTIELYLDGLIGRSEAIGRLRYEKPNCQISFRSQEVIDKELGFEGSETL
ncbi:MAG: DUF3990 domain-containing protein [Succinivibrionaceae bacterium]|nr:DUF3990 domain-containing protein [Succinivibrionaceae bacterium]